MLTVAAGVGVLGGVLAAAFVADRGLPEVMRAAALWQLRRSKALAIRLVRVSASIDRRRGLRDMGVIAALEIEVR